MNILKIKFRPFSLLIVFIVSVFVISCQQEAIKPKIDDNVLMQKMANDADVVNFSKAYDVYENELIERIKANRELFEQYLLEENYEAIDILLNVSELVPLREDMDIKKDIALSKYPALLDVFEEVSMIISGTTNTVTERCSSSFRSCSLDCEDISCSAACWWWWCESAWF